MVTVFVKITYQDQPVSCDLCKRPGHVRANCKGAYLRGRSKSKRPVRRNRSQSNYGTRPPSKTQSIWIEKSKVDPVAVDKEPLPIAQPNIDDGTNISREQGPVTATPDDEMSEKSDQEIDPLVWKEVRPKRKKKSKKKKKAVTPQPPPNQRCVPKGKEIVVERKSDVNERNQNKGDRNAGIVITEDTNRHVNVATPSPEESSLGIHVQRDRRETSKAAATIVSSEFDSTMQRQTNKGGISDKNRPHSNSAPSSKELREKERDVNSHDKDYVSARVGCSGQDGGLNPITSI